MTRVKTVRSAKRSTYVTRAMKWPPWLWSLLEERVPERERSAFVRRAVEQGLLQEGALRAQHYYATDREAKDWTDFVGDTRDQ